MLKTRFTLLLLCCTFSFLQAQNHGFQLRVQAGSNVGLYGSFTYIPNNYYYYYSSLSIQSSKSKQPKLGYGLGLQLTKKISKRFEIGIEKNLVKSQATCTYQEESSYDEDGFSAVISERKGTFYYNELFFQYPVFLRQKVGRRKRRYLEYGLDYKKMITNNNTTDLITVDYFKRNPNNPDRYTEQDRLTEPKITPLEYSGFSKNDHRLGLILGFGGPIRIKDDFEINLVCRYNSSLTLLFEERQNPYYQVFEVRVEFDVN